MIGQDIQSDCYPVMRDSVVNEIGNEIIFFWKRGGPELHLQKHKINPEDSNWNVC
jgi:hypothetical protein